jgi:hypothetical protein
MGRKSTFENYRGKIINGVQLLDKKGIINGRLIVNCKCIPCGKIFEEQFHNVYHGGRRSCGCLVGAKKSKSVRWKGFGEIGKSYFTSLKRGAKSRNLIFDISLEYMWELFLQQNRKCIMTGEVLKFSDSRISCNGTASLDRKDPKIGYVKGNIQWIRKDINFMKQTKNDLEFLDIVGKISKYRNL